MQSACTGVQESAEYFSHCRTFAQIVGRTPGPRPTPSSPFRVEEQRVQGDPRGPGGPPYKDLQW